MTMHQSEQTPPTLKLVPAVLLVVIQACTSPTKEKFHKAGQRNDSSAGYRDKLDCGERGEGTAQRREGTHPPSRRFGVPKPGLGRTRVTSSRDLFGEQGREGDALLTTGVREVALDASSGHAGVRGGRGPPRREQRECNAPM